jgi:hypothetical protein
MFFSLEKVQTKLASIRDGHNCRTRTTKRTNLLLRAVTYGKKCFVESFQPDFFDNK